VGLLQDIPGIKINVPEEHFMSSQTFLLSLEKTLKGTEIKMQWIYQCIFGRS
jgi:hypothetical protein